MSSDGGDGPPRDVLGYPAVIRQFAVRTDRAVVALQHALAFPAGCILTVHIALRRGSLAEPAWEQVRAGLTGEGPCAWPAGSGLKFGVRFPGGSLSEAGGGSASDDWSCHADRQLWLWPLPPPGPFEVVIQWQAAGIDATAATLDGTAIARAASQARPYWP